MNISTIVTRGLNRAKLSVVDIGFRDMATDLLNEIIQEHWTRKKWGFSKKSFTLSTTASTEEVTLNKLATVENIVQNSMRGSSPIRNIKFRPSSEWFRTHFSTASGNPYNYRPGSVQGFQNNPSSASVISFVSSLANYTTGTANIANGSKRVVFGGGATITIDMLGRWIRFGSDSRAYKLATRDFGSSSIFYLSEVYEGVTDNAKSFSIGDIQQKATVLGYVSGQLQEEEIQLNGTSAVPTTKSFTSFLRITKEKTYGYVTATSNSGVVSNIILDPGETEADFQTIKFDPIPSATETINYEAYIRHPHLYKPTDSPLFPSQFHGLLVLELYIRLENEWLRRDVTQETILRRDKMLEDMISIDNNTDNWNILQETEESSERSGLNNLPATYGAENE